MAQDDLDDRSDGIERYRDVRVVESDDAYKPDVVPCIYCREYISADARVCVYCRQPLPLRDADEPADKEAGGLRWWVFVGFILAGMGLLGAVRIIVRGF